MTKQPTYTIQLQPTPACRDPVKALRATLKNALRAHSLRCVSAVEAST
jgi:hypothetical protein